MFVRKGDIMSSVLTEPAIKDVIIFLEHFDPDMPFRISDPDTGWEISKLYFSKEEGKLWVTGDYSEMIKR